MPKYRYLQHVDTCVEVEVEADNEEEAREKAIKVMTHMPDEEYNQQLISSAEPGEDSIDEVLKTGEVPKCSTCGEPIDISEPCYAVQEGRVDELGEFVRGDAVSTFYHLECLFPSNT